MAMLARALLLMLVALVSACGGGGGGAERDMAGAAGQVAAPAPDKGVIKVFVGDGPVDDFDQVLMEVTEMRLLSDDGQDVVLLDQPVTIDLLQLRNVSELVVDKEIEARTYSKIRLLVNSITLVKLDDTGAVEEQVAAKVLANGKVDLNPQQDIVISPGEDLVVFVDFALDRSVHVVANGKGEYRFRPVVFVKVIDAADDARLTRLFGHMEDIDTEDGTLSLCDVQLLSGSNELPEEECLPVKFGAQTLLIGADGLPIGPEALINGNFATVLARFHWGLEVEDSYYEALLIAVGEEGNFQQLFGHVATPVTDGVFELVPDDPDAAANVEVHLVDGALVLDDDNQPVGPEAIQPDREAELWGLSVTEGEQEFFRTFLVHLDDADVAQDSVAGTLLSIDLEKDQLLLQDADLNEVCVQLDDDTAYYQLDENNERVEGGEIVIGDLPVGQNTAIEAFGEFEEGGCLDADEVVIEITSTD